MTVTPKRGVPYFTHKSMHRDQAEGVSLQELKTKIIASLRLEKVQPEQVDDDAPLFGTGLGLDSIDALELVAMLESQYGIVVKDMDEGRTAFKSVRTLGDFIAARRPA